MQHRKLQPILRKIWCPENWQTEQFCSNNVFQKELITVQIALDSLADCFIFMHLYAIIFEELLPRVWCMAGRRMYNKIQYDKNLKIEKILYLQRKFENYTVNRKVTPMNRRSTSICFFGQLLCSNFREYWFQLSLMSLLVYWMSTLPPTSPDSYVSFPCYEVF